MSIVDTPDEDGWAVQFIAGMSEMMKNRGTSYEQCGNSLGFFGPGRAGSVFVIAVDIEENAFLSPEVIKKIASGRGLKAVDLVRRVLS